MKKIINKTQIKTCLLNAFRDHLVQKRFLFFTLLCLFPLIFQLTPLYGKEISDSSSYSSDNILDKSSSQPLAKASSKSSKKKSKQAPTPAQIKAHNNRRDLVRAALDLKGAPYVLGAEGPKSFDCSGFVYYVASKSIGVQLPRTARAMYNFCSIVTVKEREVGDLVFFKTGGSSYINHVGIYMGNNQFISALSDGPSPGVSVSSLDSNYWKSAYIATGKFLPNGYSKEQMPENKKKKSKNKKKYFAFDGNLYLDWTVFNPNEVKPKVRGLEASGNLRLSQIFLQPGIGFSLKYNHGMSIFQIPLFLTLTLNDYVRFYGGPAFTFGSPKMPDTGTALGKSLLSGLVGVSFSTPSIKIGIAGLQFIQDISYTMFKGEENRLLSFKDGIYSGLMFNTGVRVTFNF